MAHSVKSHIMRKMTSQTRYQNQFTFAIYKDDGKWVAHNLELDIVAVGTTKQQALKELQHLVVNQLSFAIHHKMEDTVYHPAPERFWKMVAQKITANLIGRLASHAITSEKLKQLIHNSPVYDLTSRTRFA